MEQKLNSWEEKKLIGDNTENIVKFLINSMEDWECIKYGMENHIDGLKKILKNNSQSKNSLLIRSMPDFIAINKKTNEVLIIDVKFRSFIDRREPKTALYGFGYARIKDYLQFWPESHLIVVHNHKPFFMVIPIKEVEWHKHFYGRIEYNGKLIEQWNFAGIQKPIRSLFPDLSEEIINKAIELIPKKNGN